MSNGTPTPRTSNFAPVVATAAAVALVSACGGAPQATSDASDALVIDTAHPSAAADSSATIDPADLVLTVGQRVLANVEQLTVGNVDGPGAVHYYNFVAVAGHAYVIETLLGDLEDSVLALRDGSDTTELASDDDGGTGRASRIAWTATANGVLHVTVRSYDATQRGRYALRITDVGGLGLGDGLGYCGPFVNCPIAGEISSPGESKWIAFEAQGVQTMQLVTSMGTLEDTTMTVYASDATTMLAYNDDTTESVPPRAASAQEAEFEITPRSSALAFQPTVNSTSEQYEDRLYFVKIESYDSTKTGSYALWVQDPADLPTDLLGCIFFTPIGCAVSLIMVAIHLGTAGNAY